MSSTGTRFLSTSEVQILANNLNVNSGYKMLQGTDDPTLVAQNAPAGSLYVNTASSLIYRKLDAGSTTNWSVLGSGSASGINYVANGDFDGSISGAVTYDDGAVAAPVDGTGGASANLTLSKGMSADIIRGAGSLKVAKGAADAQGEGVSIELSTIDPADLGKPLFVSFEYKLSANYAANDLRVYAYDVTNNELQLILNGDSGYILKTDGVGYFSGKMYTTTTSSSYRLIFHTTSNSALAYDFLIDSLRVGPSAPLVASYEREEIISLAGSGNFTSGSVRASRVGNQVTISVVTALSFPSSATPASAAGAIPEWARPSVLNTNIALQTGSQSFSFSCSDAGVFALSIRDWAGAASNGTGVSSGALTYTVGDSPTNVISSTKAVTQTTPIYVESPAFSLTTAGYVSGEYAQMTNNSVTLTPGRYALFSTVAYNRGPGAIVNSIRNVWSENNGNNTSVFPGDLSTASGVVTLTNSANQFKTLQTGDWGTGGFDFEPVFIDVLQTKTIYSVVSTVFSNAGSPASTVTTRIKVLPIPSYEAFGVYRDEQFRTCDSGDFSLATAGYLTNEWAQLSNNSLTLTPGNWRIDGAVTISDSTPATADISSITCLLSTANGNNTTALPTGITVQAGLNETQVTLNASSLSLLNVPIVPVRVRVTETTTIFGNLRATFSSAGASTMRVRLYAEKIA